MCKKITLKHKVIGGGGMRFCVIGIFCLNLWVNCRGASFGGFGAAAEHRHYLTLKIDEPI